MTKLKAYFFGEPGGSVDRAVAAVFEARGGKHICSGILLAGPNVGERDVEYEVPDEKSAECAGALLRIGVRLKPAPLVETPLEGQPAVGDTLLGKRGEPIADSIIQYHDRLIAEREAPAIKEIQDKGLAFVQTLHLIGGTPETGERQATRELAIAQTKIEEAVMWAIKHITR